MSLFSAFVQSLIILGVATLLALCFKRPAMRVVLLRYAFVSLIAIFAIRLLAPGIGNPWLRAEPVRAAGQAVSAAPTVLDFQPNTPKSSSTAEVRESAKPAVSPSPKPIAKPTWSPDYRLIAFSVWSIVALVLLVKLILGFAWLDRLKRSSRPVAYSRTWDTVRDALQRYGLTSVHIVESQQLSSPMIAGVIKPTVFLPKGQQSDYDRDELYSMLAHELTHVRNRDNVWALVSQIVVTFLWPNPFAWTAQALMRNACEDVCDSDVLQSGVRPETYARCLFRLAEQSVRFAPAVGLGILSSRSSLSKRISRILVRQGEKQLPTVSHLRLASASGLIAIASCLAIPATRHSPAAISKSDSRLPVSKEREFYPSDAELKLVKASGMPYISGDFTLTYHIHSEDKRTDAQRLADYQRNRALYVKDLDQAVASGRTTRQHADEVLGQFVLGQRRQPWDADVTVSCLRGMLLYKDTSGLTSLTTRTRIYRCVQDGVYISSLFTAQNILNMPLPAAGFAHFPLTRTNRSGSSVMKVTDVPDFGGVIGPYPWESGLRCDVGGDTGTLYFGMADGKDHLLKIIARDDATPLFEYRKFIGFKGTDIASDFSRFQLDMDQHYTLTSAVSHALPESEFDPAQFVQGKNVDIENSNAHFKGDAACTDIELQIAQAESVTIVQTGEANKEQARESIVAAIPGQAPDIMPLYQKALRRAGRDGKAVLAITTASNCQPCHTLAKMLAEPSIKSVIDAHFVVVWIDCGEQESAKKYENLNGEKLSEQLDLLNGFPSYCAVDPSGRILTHVGTVGYPSDNGSKKKFFEVLDAGPKPLSDEEKKTITDYLDKNADG